MEEINIQWFPGHMAKTRRLMKANLPLVDIVVEIIDARVPVSSRNPEMKSLVGGKPRIIVLNKCDMADEGLTNEWIKLICKAHFHRKSKYKKLKSSVKSGYSHFSFIK